MARASAPTWHLTTLPVVWDVESRLLNFCIDEPLTTGEKKSILDHGVAGTPAPGPSSWDKGGPGLLFLGPTGHTLSPVSALRWR